MITIHKEFDIQTEYDLSRIGDPEKLLFFDIETTGFSAYDSSLYLIGTLHFSEGKVILDQFFADSFSSELPVLEAFFEFIRNFCGRWNQIYAVAPKHKFIFVICAYAVEA